MACTPKLCFGRTKPKQLFVEIVPAEAQLRGTRSSSFQLAQKVSKPEGKPGKTSNMGRLGYTA